MFNSTSTDPSGWRRRCQVCEQVVCVVPSIQGDAVCPCCGSQIWADHRKASKDAIQRLRDLGATLTRDPDRRMWEARFESLPIVDKDLCPLPEIGPVWELHLTDTKITDESKSIIRELLEL